MVSNGCDAAAANTPPTIPLVIIAALDEYSCRIGVGGAAGADAGRGGGVVSGVALADGRVR